MGQGTCDVGNGAGRIRRERAETPPVADADAGDVGVSTPVQLDRIVVTARRRDEVVQAVPLAVTALSGAELESRGAEDLAHWAQRSNGRLSGARVQQLDHRLSAASANRIRHGAMKRLAVYVDDVYLARPQAALLDILDVERIGVLRGPRARSTARTRSAARSSTSPALWAKNAPAMPASRWATTVAATSRPSSMCP